MATGITPSHHESWKTDAVVLAQALSYEQGNAIVDRLKPKMVIPTHYLAHGVSSTLSTLQTADEWVAAQTSKQRLDSSRLVLDPAAFATMDRPFAYIGAAVARA